MTCAHCGGTLTRGQAPFHVDRKGAHLQLDNVPAGVCNQCGEPMFDKAAVESIQAILIAVDQETEKLLKSA